MSPPPSHGEGSSVKGPWSYNLNCESILGKIQILMGAGSQFRFSSRVSTMITAGQVTDKQWACSECTCPVWRCSKDAVDPTITVIKLYPFQFKSSFGRELESIQSCSPKVSIIASCLFAKIHCCQNSQVCKVSKRRWELGLGMSPFPLYTPSYASADTNWSKFNNYTMCHGHF